MEMITSRYYSLSMIVLLTLGLTPRCATSCPLDFSILNSYSSALKDACDHGGEGNLKACCLAAASGLELSLSKYLEESGLFLLHNATQARLCLRRIRAQIQLIGVQRELVNDCGFEQSPNPNPNDSYSVSVLQWTPELCKGIHTVQEFKRIIAGGIAGTQMESSCRAKLAEPNQCQVCANAMRLLINKLTAMNASMSSECFNFVRMYVVADVSHGGPWDATTASCIYALNKDPDSRPTTSSRIRLYIGLGVAAAVGMISIALGLSLWAWLRPKTAIHRMRNHKMQQNQYISLVWYDWAVLESATEEFSPNSLLGQGGYGNVYKGILKDGRTIAVKRFKNCTLEGDQGFLSEVEVLSKFKHKNLVNLQGCCIAPSKRFGHQRALVYDYMHHRSLADYLFKDGNPTLTWLQRRNIAIGIAQGLAYLHVDAKPQIIHRDIKASNILLDAKLDAHIADFGLAKFVSGNSDSLRLSSHIKGTLGYVAPEYAIYGQLTERSDVYSFGICLLELLSGRPALVAHSWSGSLESQTQEQPNESPDYNQNSSHLITDWAWSLLVNKRALEIIDVRIRETVDSDQVRAVMTRFVMVGMLCAHAMVCMRPSMTDALRMLEGYCAVPVDRVFERPFVTIIK